MPFLAWHEVKGFRFMGFRVCGSHLPVRASPRVDIFPKISEVHEAYHIYVQKSQIMVRKFRCSRIRV